MPKQQEFCMMHYIKLYGRFRAAFIMALVLSVSASCTRIEIVPRPEPESGAIIFNPKVKTDSWLSVSPASAKSGAVPPEYSLCELRDAQGRRRLYLHSFSGVADASASPLPGTRGTAVNNNNFDDVYGSFGVTAYAYRGKWADGGGRTLYISDKQASGKNGTYDFNPSVFWPGEEFNMAFFAYAPYGAVDPDGTDEDGFPEFSYTVPEKIEDQKDLLAWWGTDYSRKTSGEAGSVQGTPPSTSSSSTSAQRLSSRLATAKTCRRT